MEDLVKIPGTAYLIIAESLHQTWTFGAHACQSFADFAAAAEKFVLWSINPTLSHLIILTLYAMGLHMLSRVVFVLLQWLLVILKFLWLFLRWQFHEHRPLFIITVAIFNMMVAIFGMFRLYLQQFLRRPDIRLLINLYIAAIILNWSLWLIALLKATWEKSIR